MYPVRLWALAVANAAAVLMLAHSPTAVAQVSTPEIRVGATNRVPACVTPDRMMQHLRAKNPKLDARFADIAALYKQHGEAYGVRWDYAVYQMILETKYLMFGGDVKARQNNFAGVGATGGGVRGDGFPDVSTGVLAQMQHLVAYSGERVENPVAARTREVQNDVIAKSKRLGRPVRFADLTNRWAADRSYATSIELIAGRYRQDFCAGKVRDDEIAAAPAPAVAAAVPPKASRGAELARRAVDRGGEKVPRAGLGVQSAAVPCSVMTASYGGSGGILVRVAGAGDVTFTALGVEPGQEQAMAESFIRSHAEGGSIAGRFRSRDEAVAKAWALCDSGQP